MAGHEHDHDLPPSVPDALEDLEVAVRLLGNRAQQADLKAQARTQLESLIGVYPSKKKAARWKVALKGLAREMRGMQDP